MKKLMLLILLCLTANIYAVPGHNLCYYEDNYACCDETPLGWCSKEGNMVFKILKVEEWNKLKEQGVFYGSSNDQRDGFIHLSNSKQLGPILDKYFKGVPVYIVGFYPRVFGENLVWESSYPHLYNIPVRLSNSFGYGFYEE